MRNLKLLLLLLLLTAIPAYAGKIKNSEQLVQAMHKKYSGKWYKTLTFVQKNTRYRPDGTIENSVWYEAMSLPGKLRIDFAPMENDTGMMFLDGQLHNLNKGKLAGSRPTIHPLMVLGFDVYSQPVETTLKQLKELKFDLSTMRLDKDNGRDVYIVGANKGDLKSAQFWIDKKHLYLVKTIQPAGRDGKSTQEIQFNKYQKVRSGGWIAPEVVFIVDGKRSFLEEYSDMQFNVELNDNLFIPEKWADADKDYYKKKD
jgi:outer membrane lipoprotein-sorting protein